MAQEGETNRGASARTSSNGGVGRLCEPHRAERNAEGDGPSREDKLSDPAHIAVPRARHRSAVAILVDGKKVQVMLIVGSQVHSGARIAGAAVAQRASSSSGAVGKAEPCAR